MDEKNQLALIEGGKKAACVVTNAALFFFLPVWVFGDTSWMPADPVWVHITITMLCELDTMDRLNEKILLRTAGTTIGALAGCIMIYPGLNDFMRLVIMFSFVLLWGFIEKKDPTRSYTWTIATVTFGICTYLGRMGKFMTPWKRWWSIVLGTIVTAIWLLLLPWLGVLPKKIVRDELGETAKAAWNGCVVMLEDAIENPGDAEAGKRLSAKQSEVNGLLSKWPASWKQYKYARNWINLQPKKVLPMDGLQVMLKDRLFELFLSTAAACRVLHRTGDTGDKERIDNYAILRVSIHKMGSAISSVVTVVAKKETSPQRRLACLEECEMMTTACEFAAKQLVGMPLAHQAVLSACLGDTVNLIKHIHDGITMAHGGGKKNDAVKERFNKLLKELAQVEVASGK